MTSKHVIVGLVFLRVLILVGFLARQGRVLLNILSREELSEGQLLFFHFDINRGSLG
jgi:hypothetical protein